MESIIWQKIVHREKDSYNGVVKVILTKEVNGYSFWITKECHDEYEDEMIWFIMLSKKTQSEAIERAVVETNGPRTKSATGKKIQAAILFLAEKNVA